MQACTCADSRPTPLSELTALGNATNGTNTSNLTLASGEAAAGLGPGEWLMANYSNMTGNWTNGTNTSGLSDEELRAISGAYAAFEPLYMIAVTCLSIVAFLWVRDFFLLACGWADLGGERIVGGVAEEEDAVDEAPKEGETPISRRIVPPPEWRRFKTALGTDYFLDPSSEVVYYLTAAGKANYAVDTNKNRSFHFDTLDGLREQMAAAEHAALYGAPPPTSSTSRADAPQTPAAVKVLGKGGGQKPPGLGSAQRRTPFGAVRAGSGLGAAAPAPSDAAES